MKRKTTARDASALNTFPELPRVGIPKQPRSWQMLSKPCLVRIPQELATKSQLIVQEASISRGESGSHIEKSSCLCEQHE